MITPVVSLLSKLPAHSRVGPRSVSSVPVPRPSSSESLVTVFIMN